MAALISVDAALDILFNYRLGLPAIDVPLAEALGARLAAQVTARVTLPPQAVSAMDGYAVRLSDVTVPGVQLRVIGEAPAGTAFTGMVEAGEAVRIFTGGAVPTGADHILIQENAVRDGDVITCQTGESRPRHIREAGLDFSSGDVLIAAGTRLEPGHIAVAAAANHAAVSIYHKPVVAIIANGDELREPGSDLNPSDIVSSNPAGLGALVASWGGEPLYLGIAGDRLSEIEALIEKARSADIIVPVGGASVGDHDHMRTAFERAGFTERFAKIAVRPGKPTWFGTLGPARVLGLPGNPASAMVCAHIFLKPLVTGENRLDMAYARLASPLAANGWRETFLRARASLTGEGILEVTPLSRQDSSLLTPFLKANCLIRRSIEAPALEVGAVVDILPMRPLT